MDAVPYLLPGAIATYSAKSALFTAGLADRGTFFDNTGSYTISLAAAATLGAGWSCWIRNVSGTQVIDPNGAELINGAATYSVSNAGDVVLVECTGTAFVISHMQRPATVALTGGFINGIPIGSGTAAAGAFTTLSSTGDAALLRVVCDGDGSVAGRLTLTNKNVTASIPFLLIDDYGTAGRTILLRNPGLGTKYNFQVAAQRNIDNGFEITPSTAAGGSTYSTPAIQIAGATGVVKVGAIAATYPGNVLAGVQDGTAAVAGQVGEVLTANTSTYTNFTNTATYQQLNTLSLTAGDWDIHATVTFFSNAATLTANADSIAVIATATAAATGAVEGQSIAYVGQNGIALATNKETVVMAIPLILTGSASYYLNGQATFTGGNPQYVSHFWARRTR